MADCTVLDYHNSVLKQSDVDLLKGPHWLNDRLIGFWFEYLENEVFQDDSVCFVSPEVTQFIKLGSRSETALVVEPLNFGSKSYILLPINNSNSLDSPGGSHWSLLVYCKEEKLFFHFDSMEQLNSSEAKKTADNLNLTLLDLVEPRTLQQNNGSDCGIFVCCYAKFVMEQCFLKKQKVKSLVLLDGHVILDQRKLMITLIEKLSSKF